MINFNLDRDLIFLDIESTGLHVIHDRIIQLALIKYSKDQDDPVEYTTIVNPGREISEEAIAVHGITPEMVADKPFFKDIAREVYDFIGDADFAGYNSNKFDVPMLMEELDRAGLPRSEEHTSELQSRENLVCRLLLEKKNNNKSVNTH